MLSTPNALAVTFRDVLQGDPLQNELLGILGKKYAPAPSQCPPAAPAPAPPSGVTLPGVTLTDEASWSELHALVEQRIRTIREGFESIVRYNLQNAKNQLLKLVPALSRLLAQARRAKVAALQETDATKKAEGLKKAGDAYTGLLYVTELWKLYVSIAVATDAADAAGEPSGVRSRPEENPLGKRLLDFENDNALLALTQAGLDGDAPAMEAALPAARLAYERHVTSLDRWIASLNRGAFLSKKVIQVADIAMIAISIHQVAKMPVVPAGGSPTPPTILGTLPGGAAVGSGVSLPSLARALEAIRKLVAIGALDGALIGGIGSLGGGPSIALPELQRPTSLAVQVPPTSQSTVPPSNPKGVEIVDRRGSPIGEFDEIEPGKRFIEDKSATGVGTPNPSTGRVHSTPTDWARKNVFEKTKVRIENLTMHATATRPTQSGSPVVPSLAEIAGIRTIHFRISSTDQAVQAAVNAELANLRTRFPGWTFTVQFGS
jgi:hypothetical protein